MKPKLPNIPISLPHELHADIRRAAKETHLSQADIMRQSIRIGLPKFVKGFPKPEKTAKSAVK